MLRARFMFWSPTRLLGGNPPSNATISVGARSVSPDKDFVPYCLGVIRLVDEVTIFMIGKCWRTQGQ